MHTNTVLKWKEENSDRQQEKNVLVSYDVSTSTFHNTLASVTMASFNKKSNKSRGFSYNVCKYDWLAQREIT